MIGATTGEAVTRQQDPLFGDSDRSLYRDLIIAGEPLRTEVADAMLDALAGLVLGLPPVLLGQGSGPRRVSFESKLLLPLKAHEICIIRRPLPGQISLYCDVPQYLAEGGLKPITIANQEVVEVLARDHLQRQSPGRK